MLQRLSIENYALIDKLEMEITPELNIITGETGAGKSILLGALGMLLGNKSDGAAIKDNDKNCRIEAQFSLEGLELEQFFADQDIDYEAISTITRIITPAGRSRSFVNDVPVQLGVLRELGNHLIDIHSQHANGVVSDPEWRISMLDTFAHTTKLIAKYKAQFTELQSLKLQLANLREVARRGAAESEWLRFQVEELESSNLKLGEIEELEAEQTILANADSIGEGLTHSHAVLDNEESGILMQLKSLHSALSRIESTLPQAGEYAQRVQTSLVDLKDIDEALSDHIDQIEVDPQRLATIDERLSMLYTLLQKHRCSDIAQLIELRDDYSNKLATIVGSDEMIAQLEKQIDTQHSVTEQIAIELHEKRSAVAPKLSDSITKQLSKLGVEDGIFEVNVDRSTELNHNGLSCVNFGFSANKGKTPQPVEKVASGGEISRIMLVIKSLLAKYRKLPTIIFDEIDTGVSGRIADAMGEIIAQLSKDMQVIDITHLPQVASKGDSHFVVFKEKGRTDIKLLSDEERRKEIAKMLSGSTISQAALEQADLLLGKR